MKAADATRKNPFAIATGARAAIIATRDRNIGTPRRRNGLASRRRFATATKTGETAVRLRWTHSSSRHRMAIPFAIISTKAHATSRGARLATVASERRGLEPAATDDPNGARRISATEVASDQSHVIGGPKRIGARNPRGIGHRGPGTIGNQSPKGIGNRNPRGIGARDLKERGERNPKGISARSHQEIGGRSPKGIGARNLKVAADRPSLHTVNASAATTSNR